MADYIEREALVVAFRLAAKQTVTTDSFWLKGYADGLDAASNAVEEAPAADVVEVVRCKDCRFRRNNICIRKVKCGGAPDAVRPAFFCAAGKRR